MIIIKRNSSIEKRQVRNVLKETWKFLNSPFLLSFAEFFLLFVGNLAI